MNYLNLNYNELENYALENKENYIVGVDNLSNYYSVKLKKERLQILSLIILHTMLKS